MIKKINVLDLEIGMFVSDLNVSYSEHPFLTNQVKIKSAKDIEKLLKYNIKDVYIDTARGGDSLKAIKAEEADAVVREELKKELKVAAEAPPEPQEPQEPGVGKTPAQLEGFKEELVKAKEVYSEAKVLVKDLLTEARMGKTVDGERAQLAVSGMVDSIFRNQDALLSLSRLKSYDDYTFQHCLNVSVLTLAVGRNLGFVKEELKKLGVGAILHDVGKMQIPDHILNKPGRFTDEEFEIMKQHPLLGAKILMDAPDVDTECSAVALNHHERFTGKGYPRGLTGMAIGKFGLVSAIVDVYDAITSDRCYHKGMTNVAAIQKIYEWSKTDFYPVYVQKFIQCLGVYPIGTLVLLDTGELGVVYNQNHNDLLKPWVRLVTKPTGEPLDTMQDVDLREKATGGPKEMARSIASVVDPLERGVDVEKVLSK